MYKIIGADQKEYGPVTSEQIRQWIAERRANADTRARLEGDQEWKPLSSFPEFADALGIASIPAPIAPATHVHPGASGDASAAAQVVKGPAIALIVTASLELLFGLLGLLRRGATMDMYANMPQFNDPEMQRILQIATGPIGIISTVIQLLVSGVILFGAIRMLALKNYGLAFTACVLSVIPCMSPCCGLLTLPFGIWALVVLNKPAVKTQFN